jgi:hypothetical protein
MQLEKRANYYAGGPIARSIRQTLKFLVMKTISKRDGRELWKFAGGMSDSIDLGFPVLTLEREYREETNLRFRHGRHDDARLLRKITLEGHDKYFYLVWKQSLEGILRTEIIEDDDTVLYPPEWKSFEFLDRNLYDTHRVVLPELKELKEDGLRLCA